MDDGLIEYLDVNEMNDAQIAVYEREIKPVTTHLEVSREKINSPREDRKKSLEQKL